MTTNHLHQRTYYNKSTRQLLNLYDSHLCMWASALVTGSADTPCPFVIHTGNRQMLRRNRKHLRALLPAPDPMPCSVPHPRNLSQHQSSEETQNCSKAQQDLQHRRKPVFLSTTNDYAHCLHLILCCRTLLISL